MGGRGSGAFLLQPLQCLANERAPWRVLHDAGESPDRQCEGVESVLLIIGYNLSDEELGDTVEGRGDLLQCEGVGRGWWGET
jgi:hypothetical protein